VGRPLDQVGRHVARCAGGSAQTGGRVKWLSANCWRYMLWPLASAPWN